MRKASLEINYKWLRDHPRCRVRFHLRYVKCSCLSDLFILHVGRDLAVISQVYVIRTQTFSSSWSLWALPSRRETSLPSRRFVKEKEERLDLRIFYLWAQPCVQLSPSWLLRKSLIVLKEIDALFWLTTYSWSTETLQRQEPMARDLHDLVYHSMLSLRESSKIFWKLEVISLSCRALNGKVHDIFHIVRRFSPVPLQWDWPHFQKDWQVKYLIELRSLVDKYAIRKPCVDARAAFNKCLPDNISWKMV